MYQHYHVDQIKPWTNKDNKISIVKKNIKPIKLASFKQVFHRLTILHISNIYWRWNHEPKLCVKNYSSFAYMAKSISIMS